MENSQDTKRQGEGDITSSQNLVKDDVHSNSNEDPWESSSDSEEEDQQRKAEIVVVTEKWKQLYHTSNNKTPTPEEPSPSADVIKDNLNKLSKPCDSSSSTKKLSSDNAVVVDNQLPLQSKEKEQSQNISSRDEDERHQTILPEDEGRMDWSVSSNDSVPLGIDSKTKMMEDTQGQDTTLPKNNSHKLEVITEILSDNNLQPASPSSIWSNSVVEDFSRVPNEEIHSGTKIDSIFAVSKANNNSKWANSAPDPELKVEDDKLQIKVNTTTDNLADWSSDDDNISEKFEKSDIPTCNQNNLDLTTDKLSDLNPQTNLKSITKDKLSPENDSESPFGFPKEKIPKNITTLFMSKPDASILSIPTESSSSLTKETDITKPEAKDKPLNVSSTTKHFKKPQAISKLISSNSTYREPIPYSTLVLSDPTKLRKQLSRSARELNNETQGMENLKASVSKSINDFTTTTSTSTTSVNTLKSKKPFFSKLKGKLSQITRSRSSSTKTTNSLSNIVSESEAMDNMSENPEDDEESIVIEDAVYNQRLMNLLIDAKKILVMMLCEKESPNEINLNQIIDGQQTTSGTSSATASSSNIQIQKSTSGHKSPSKSGRPV